MNDRIKVKMVKKNSCRDKGFAEMASIFYPTFDHLSDEEYNILPDNDDNFTTGETLLLREGGSKSRRKPMRKTRCGRGRKSKSRPKTHRRRRAHHSRAQKHKKYRSRRR